MSKDFQLDYIDVATRIVEFRTKHPEGSLQQVSIEFVNIGGKDFVVFTGAAYRTPDDARPGHGTAWEPIPGATNFTRGSEVQNAETAAWGRAIVAALAADTKRGVASAEEVRNRQEARENPLPPDERPDPLTAARLLLKEAWESSHGGAFDPAEVSAEFEQWAAIPFADAAPEDLERFAVDITRPPQTEGGGEAAESAPPADDPPSSGRKITPKQVTTLSIAFTEMGLDHDAALDWLEKHVGRRVESRKDLTAAEAKRALDDALMVTRGKGAPDAVV